MSKKKSTSPRRYFYSDAMMNVISDSVADILKDIPSINQQSLSDLIQKIRVSIDGITRLEFANGYQKAENNQRVYNDLGIFDLKLIKDLVESTEERKTVETKYGFFEVNTRSLRYKCFNRSLSCAICGLVGSEFILQNEGEINKKPHFNLYGIENGRRILMTKDHIQPVSKGGKDNIENLRTCCIVCNVIRGNNVLSDTDVLMIRNNRKAKSHVQ